jgi:uncharacterized protein with PIN domain
MEIIRHGNRHSEHLMGGKCLRCGCIVRVKEEETREMVDRDTLPGGATRYVHCPECENEYLWVK